MYVSGKLRIVSHKIGDVVYVARQWVSCIYRGSNVVHVRRKPVLPMYRGKGRHGYIREATQCI